MNRSEAREHVMQMFFQMEIQMDFSKEAKTAYIANFVDENSQLDYIDDVYEAYAAHPDELDEIIEDASIGWALERISKVDLAILRVCIAEMKFKTGEKVPVAVAINEAVKMAKKFGGNDSGKFVNGILGTVAKR
jgi:N utilization substance protein B